MVSASTPDEAVWVPFLASDIGPVFLSTQVSKWIPATLMLGISLRWTSIPASRNIFSRFITCTEIGISSSLLSHLAHMQTSSSHFLLKLGVVLILIYTRW